MDVLVLGLGVSGRSVAEYLLACGECVWAYDHHAETLRGNHDVAALLARGLQLSAELPEVRCAYAVLSPGIATGHPFCRRLAAEGIPILGEIEFACRYLRHPMIGITGTNGKTTVTLQIAHTLMSSGIPARAVGNVGIPLTQMLLESACERDGGIPILVIELSSYQLETLQRRYFDLALLLNITPDHLDRYPSFDAYAAAKWRLAACLKPGAPFYIAGDVVVPAEAAVEDVSIRYFCGADGSFEERNLMAVTAACSHWGVTERQTLDAAATFKKPPHRLQYVASIDGVDFYDDSKGTNVDAVLKAVETLAPRRLYLIAGGLAKGASFACWRAPFRGRVAAVYAIGTSAPQLAAELKGAVDVHVCADLDAAVCAAYAAAVISGGTVLLSPGCASTDMFRDYADRGTRFQAAVSGLNNARCVS